MAHAHYVVLFAGLMFRKKHATKHRGPVVDQPNPARQIAQRDGRSLTKNFSYGRFRPRTDRHQVSPAIRSGTSPLRRKALHLPGLPPQHLLRNKIAESAPKLRKLISEPNELGGPGVVRRRNFAIRSLQPYSQIIFCGVATS
jgi:hypothetical protein